MLYCKPGVIDFQDSLGNIHPMTITVSELIPVLQVAIGSVVLISGVGLLILSLTNRLGRVIDRGRSLVREIPEVSEGNRPTTAQQLRILSRRAIITACHRLCNDLCFGRGWIGHHPILHCGPSSRRCLAHWTVRRCHGMFDSFVNRFFTGIESIADCLSFIY